MHLTTTISALCAADGLNLTKAEVAQAHLLKLRRQRVDKRVERLALRLEHALARGKSTTRLLRATPAIEREIASLDADFDAFVARVEKRLEKDGTS